MVESVSYNMPSGAERDAGLDFVRALALILMVIAHFSTAFHVPGRLYEVFRFVGETAPVFFFFAFGMTFDRFLRKPSNTKVESSILFIYVGLAHNLIVSGLFVMAVLAVLCIWRAVLAAFESRGAIQNRYYLGVCGLVLACQLLISPQFTHYVLQWGQENDPLVSWGLFILAGLIYMRIPGLSRRLLFIFTALGFTACVLLFGSSAGPNWAFTKYPLSAPYTIAFCGACAFLVEAIRLAAGFYRAVPVLPRVLEFISKNLLLGTAVHYFIYPAVADLIKAVLSRSRQLSMPLPDPLVFFFSGLALSLVLAVALLWAVIKFWDGYRGRSLFTRLRANYHRNAIILLAADAGLIKLRRLIKHSPPAFLDGRHLAGALSIAITIICFGILTYYCLEMTEHRFATKKRDETD